MAKKAIKLPEGYGYAAAPRKGAIVYAKKGAVAYAKSKRRRRAARVLRQRRRRAAAPAGYGAKPAA